RPKPSATAPRRSARALTARRARRPPPPDPARVRAILDILAATYPEARSALDYRNAFELLVATILSAQCTDVRVNQVTPALFARWPDARAIAAAPVSALEATIRPTGFFRNKTKALKAAAADIVAHHGGEVPRTMEELTALHGVGRKTANVVLGNAHDVP